MALRKDASSGITASTDSFYVGQGRPGFRGYMPSFARELLADLRSSRVLCFEMESSVLFTLGRLFDISTGAIFAVLANRSTNEFVPDAGVDDAIAVTIEAVRRLSDGRGPKRNRR
jgi:uridine phosphorylase